MRIGNNARAATAYNLAILASLDKLGIVSSGFIAAYGNETAASITLEKIITQKYITLYTQAEAWSDWRRTGYPNIKPAYLNVTGSIPRRLIYPLDESNYNISNVPGGLTLMDRVWWDK